MDFEYAGPEDEYLTRCVIDPMLRKVYLYSSEEDQKTVDCDSVDEFMILLEFLRDTLDDECLAYAEPVVAS